MKKLFFVSAIALFGMMNAQSTSVVSKGTVVLETNAGSPLHIIGGGTNFALTAVKGETVWNIGAEGGYFVMDNLAIKAGLGYGQYGGDNGVFTYRLGAQYYIGGKFPLAADFTGISSEGESVNWIGVEGGYAWFVAPNIAITPKVRYNITVDEMKAPSSFQGLIGFSLFFK